MNTKDNWKSCDAGHMVMHSKLNSILFWMIFKYVYTHNLKIFYMKDIWNDEQNSANFGNVAPSSAHMLFWPDWKKHQT